MIYLGTVPNNNVMPYKKPMHKMSVYLDPTLLEQLDKAAAQWNVTRTKAIEMCVKQVVAEPETVIQLSVEGNDLFIDDDK